MLLHVTFGPFWICLEKQRQLFQLNNFKNKGLGAWFVRIIEKLERKLKTKSEKRRKKIMGSNYNYNYNNVPMKMKMMKRKEFDVDDVSDELHDISLTSPARKIRRLNAQLPPIMEEEKEQEILPVPVAVESSDSDADKAKAIVLYKPPSQTHSSPNLSVSLDLVSGFKNQFLRTSQSGNLKLYEDEELPEKNDAMKNSSLAVVPWVPSQFQLLPTPGMDALQTEATELMEADDMGEATMDIEENNNPSIGQGNAYEFGGMRDNDGLNQWQQQHCMIPQLPQTASTPITWFW